MPDLRVKKVCNICDGRDFAEIIDLGKMPPANAFLKKADFRHERTFPLAVQLCKNCRTLQLCHTVSPSFLFKKYYYATGASEPLVRHFHRLADEIAEDHAKSPTDLVVEIGSNDGALLSIIKDRRRVLGVDPAYNIAKVASRAGVPTKVGFFSSALAQEILDELGEAKVVVANNVIAHIDEIRDVLLGVKKLLSENGKFIFEVHWVGNLLNDGGFDQIYHEHIYYYSLHGLRTLLQSLGMKVLGVKLVPVHGQSIRVYTGKLGKSSAEVPRFLDREVKMGLVDLSTYRSFSRKVELNKKKLRELLSSLKKEGKRIAGYGASAKGNTLLNYFKIGPETLDYITDTTPQKQGTYTPGTHIRIVPPDMLKKETPDYVLLLSWNYAEAILEKEKELRKSGTKFIIPVPTVRIV